MTPRGFADHFSGHAAAYARARPGYPRALFDWLGSIAPRGARPRRAWDCGCGNGQASIGLAAQFDEVVGTDASVTQLRNASHHERVAYAACTAERASLASGTMSLTTVAQALHWMDLDAFYAEVRRVSGPGGVLAAWSYGQTRIAPEIDAVLGRFHQVTIAPYWPPERQLVDEGYATLAFPFDEIAPPALSMQREWTVRELLDYVGTWSAVVAMRRATGTDPIEPLARELGEVWADGERRSVRWPLAIRAGYVGAE